MRKFAIITKELFTWAADRKNYLKSSQNHFAEEGRRGNYGSTSSSPYGCDAHLPDRTTDADFLQIINTWSHQWEKVRELGHCSKS